MDIELYYTEKGEGAPLILLHGNGEDGSYFEHQIKYFSGRYRVIAIDTRGHGKSARGEAPFTVKQFSEDLYGFFELHGIEKAILLGFSDGANIAMYFALKHEDRLAALILNGGNLDPSGVKRSTQIPIERAYERAVRSATVSERAKREAELLGLMVNEPSIKPSELSALTVPTLVISGTRDVIKTSHTRAIAKAIPNSALALIAGDHFIANNAHKEFNGAVESFFSSYGL